MRKRYLLGAGLVILAVLCALVVWQVSFNFGPYGPTNAAQAFSLWAVSTLIFVLTVLLSFLLFRTAVKLYLERNNNREGSRIKFKLVFGALALSLLPVVFLFAFSYGVLNRNIEKWFSRPAEGIRIELIETGVALGDEIQGRATALVNWIAGLEQSAVDLPKLCRENRIDGLRIELQDGSRRELCPAHLGAGAPFTARADSPSGGTLVLTVYAAADMAEQQHLIQRYVQEYDQLSSSKRSLRNLYLLFLVMIALFILFVSTWIALLLSRQISTPITALLEAASQVRQGNLSYRVQTKAIDELATLVRAFNEMTQELQANSTELESRRRFTEAILESIPTGVISVSSDGAIERVNRALRGLFQEEEVERAAHLRDLFAADDLKEIRYLMHRAQRTGMASTQLDLKSQGQVKHLAVTVSSLPARRPAAPGFVLVLEDTSDLLRAQRVEAWQEVARRIAHELKNPITPISLCAERITRQLDRGALTPDAQRIMRECAAIISREAESVKTLADEFSQLSRFPAAQPVPSSLNDIIHNALDVFAGRLEGIDLRTDLAPNLPPVNVDTEQFKRVMVNLVDNAAEAMQDTLVKRMLVASRLTAADTVEVLVADTGTGVSPEDKERLFLPYFSTKGRGTGLGLAIVSRIVTEHHGRIRVEDNRPSGTRFLVELPIAAPAESDARIPEGGVEVRA